MGAHLIRRCAGVRNPLPDDPIEAQGHHRSQAQAILS